VRTQPRIADISCRVLALSVLIGILFVVGCAGGGTQNSSSAPVTYTIGGTISGLSGTGLVLQNNGGNNLSVSTNGSFTFTTAVASGSTFNVTVFSQPSNPAQTCVVASGSGTASANVTAVVVTCTTIYTIGGTVSGLSGTGLVLQNNGGNNLTVSANGSFTFTTALASGTAYSVTVATQPSNPAQTCGVTAGGSGTVTSANVTSVMVTCIGSASFVLTGGMTSTRMEHTATLLNNGMVLIAGGISNFNNTVLASAELYNPVTGTFTATGYMTSPRYRPTATLLNNGKVLIAGGDINGGALVSAELYDPATGTFTATGSMTSIQDNHTATLLNNGKVLIVGGIGSGGTSLASAELYNPATGTFTATGSMTSARTDHTATLLNNGDVLVAGGAINSPALASAELYNPVTGTFAVTGSMTAAREVHTATLLNNGKVLVTGGDSGTGFLASAELYDPATGTFSATGSMTTARIWDTATLLNNGNVLVAGGINTNALNAFALASAELYNPVTGTFSATGSMTDFRVYHTATLLNNGNVLVAGGQEGVSGIAPVASAELYSPSTLTPTGLVSITVTPANPTLSSVGLTQQFIATGTFSGGSMQNLQSVTWSSSNQAAGTITNDASNHGVALALAAGQSTITASAGSINGSTVLTVQ
jgi:Bacterial Ig-like domain (group 2)/Galactose oxidase, central domain/Kelch motif